MDTFATVCSRFSFPECVGANEQSYDPWVDLHLLGLEADHLSPTDVEKIYAGIHKSVDQAVSTILQQGSFTSNTVEQQNRKVFEKLYELEKEVLRRTSLTSTSSLSVTSMLAVSVRFGYFGLCATESDITMLTIPRLHRTLARR